MKIIYNKPQIRFSQKEIESLTEAMQIINDLTDATVNNNCIFNYEEDKIDGLVLYEVLGVLQYLIERGTK